MHSTTVVWITVALVAYITVVETPKTLSNGLEQLFVLLAIIAALVAEMMCR